MARPGEREKMRTFILGNDRGNAVLAAIVLIMILATLFISFVPRITALNNFAREYKERALQAIERENREIRERYDLY
jgi:hypothetical protein